MTAQILTTKLYIPPLRTNHLSRPHLIQRLEAGSEGKLTLISAPAGYGKTTLVAEWISVSNMPFCWISLDESDNDVGRFLAYFIASLDSINIAVDQQLPGLIQSPQQIKIDAILIPLLNQITVSQMDFAIVLDDYHLIQNKEIQDALTYIIEHSPPTMHLVIVTRADPHLPLSRLRARGQMTEIRASDLRFSVEEGEILLNQVYAFKLPSKSIETLVERSDGWIAALQMISLALQERPDPDVYIQGFSGSQTYITDYLTDEVLQGQTQEIKNFLIQTSILDRLSGPLCDAVLGREDSHQILKTLRDTNLFLTSLDDKNHWFRYHRLFADLLQGRLLESRPEILPELYLDASRWFEDNGYPSEAIEYAFRGDKIERAAALIKQHAKATIMQSEISTFKRWVEKLPESLVVQEPTLCILYAWVVLVYDGQTPVARSYLEKVEPVDEHVCGQVNTVRSILAVFDKQFLTGVELARQALEQLPDQDHFFRNIAGWNLSGALAVSGDTQAALEVLAEVIQTSLADRHYLVAIIALCRLAGALAQRGELHRARDTYAQAIEIASTGQRGTLPAASEGMMGLGKIYWEWNQTGAARETLIESITLSKRWRENTAIDSYVTLAQIQQAQGDVRSANQSIGEAQKLAGQTTATENDDKYVAFQRVYLMLRQGDLQSAQRWAAKRGLGNYIGVKKLDLSGNLGSDVILHYELIAFSKVLIAEKHYDQALSLLKLLLPLMEQLGYLKKIIEIHILTASGLYAQGKTEAAVSSLVLALKLAQPEGFARVFLDEGDFVADLLKEIEVRGQGTEFERGLLNTLTPSVGKPRPPADLVDPLSERELEVLRMLRTELSAPEIAQHLHISVTTMRTHTRNIYSKLGVHSRFEAVTRAEKLALF